MIDCFSVFRNPSLSSSTSSKCRLKACPNVLFRFSSVHHFLCQSRTSFGGKLFFLAAWRRRLTHEIFAPKIFDLSQTFSIVLEDERVFLHENSAHRKWEKEEEKSYFRWKKKSKIVSTKLLFCLEAQAGLKNDFNWL